jgi:hypothetical protein
MECTAMATPATSVVYWTWTSNDGQSANHSSSDRAGDAAHLTLRDVVADANATCWATNVMGTTNSTVHVMLNGIRRASCISEVCPFLGPSQVPDNVDIQVDDENRIQLKWQMLPQFAGEPQITVHT